MPRSRSTNVIIGLATAALAALGLISTAGAAAPAASPPSRTISFYSVESFKFTEDKKACTASGAGSGSDLAISHGTGAYAGITGSISIKATFVEIGKLKNGVCENLERHASAAVSSFSGTGHVSY